MICDRCSNYLIKHYTPNSVINLDNKNGRGVPVWNEQGEETINYEKFVFLAEHYNTSMDKKRVKIKNKSKLQSSKDEPIYTVETKNTSLIK